MKIKQYKNINTKRVLVEFDEFYSHTFDVSSDSIDVIATQFNGRRMAYNMWEFENNEVAEQFSFAYKLKHADNS